MWERLAFSRMEHTPTETTKECAILHDSLIDILHDGRLLSCWRGRSGSSSKNQSGESILGTLKIRAVSPAK